MGISLFGIILLLLLAVILVLTVVGCWHINKLRMYYMNEYTHGMSAGKDRLVRWSVGGFLIFQVLYLLSSGWGFMMGFTS